MKNSISHREWNFFWNYVDKGAGCWIYRGCILNSGYGQIKFRNKKFSAHRLAYLSKYGDFDHGLHVLHKCDVRACVNPDHLFLGTNSDNMRDRNEKGRQARGATHPNSKFTEEDVLEIRRLYSSGIKQTELGKKYKCRQGHISNIIVGRSWKHVKGALKCNQLYNRTPLGLSI